MLATKISKNVTSLATKPLSVFFRSLSLEASVAAAPAVSAPAEAPKQRHTKEAKKLKLPSVILHKALTVVRSHSWAKFDETVDICVKTSLDPRKPIQAVKGVANLPCGTGKKIRVCVIASAVKAKEAIDAGAEVVGGEDLVAQIQGGNLNFDTVIATPDMMALVGKLGKVSDTFLNIYIYICILLTLSAMMIGFRF
jgi:hypothetical protein